MDNQYPARKRLRFTDEKGVELDQSSGIVKDKQGTHDHESIPGQVST